MQNAWRRSEFIYVLFGKCGYKGRKDRRKIRKQAQFY